MIPVPPPKGGGRAFDSASPGGGPVPDRPPMPYYESVLIARQEIGNAEAEQLGERYEALLGEQGATVVRREYWGLRKLAYRVRKNRKGHYLMFHVDGPGAAIQELERRLRIDEDVIRYLSMRIDAIPEEPSVIMRARAEREERREQEAAQREGKDGREDSGKGKSANGGTKAESDGEKQKAAPDGDGSAATGETRAADSAAGEAPEAGGSETADDHPGGAREGAGKEGDS